MPKRVLITGVDGFTGRYLVSELANAGWCVAGLAKHPIDWVVPGLNSIHTCDMSDRFGLLRVIAAVQPDAVVHLAAISFVGHGDVYDIYQTNLLGTRNLLEALVSECTRHNKLPKAVLIASSANIYGNTTYGMLDETASPAPTNDYAISKLAMEYVARLYADRLPIITTRPFNYTGVGQSESFLIPKIVGHIRRKASLIELGNLEVSRDFLDVRSVVQYYRHLLDSPSAVGQVFNICSGSSYTLQEIIRMVRRISRHDFEVRVNPAFVRANEVKLLLGNPEKIITTVGPVPVIPLQETLRWMLEDGEIQ